MSLPSFLLPARGRLTLAAGGFILLASQAGADQLLVQPPNSNWDRIESFVNSQPHQDPEAADDFNLEASIERLVIEGAACTGCLPPSLLGVWVRFYDWTAAGPGSLAYSTFVPVGDPGLLVNPASPADVDVILPTPFQATGKHFVSVQLQFHGESWWGWWMSNHNNPSQSSFRWRDRSDGDSWGSYLDALGNPVNSDLALAVHGTPGLLPGPQSYCGQWTPENAVIPREAIHSVLRDSIRLPDGTAWAAGEYLSITRGDYRTQTLIQRWDGASWTITPSPNPAPVPELTHCDLWGVHGTSNEDVWAVGTKNHYDGGPVYIGTHAMALHWDGSSWTERVVPLPGGGSSVFFQAAGDRIEDVYAAAPDDAWFVGQWFVFLPSDAVIWPAMMMHWNGSSFEVLTNPFHEQIDETLVSIHGTGASNIWAVGQRTLGANSRAVMYHYDGSSWTEVSIPTPGAQSNLWSVHAVSGTEAWAAGSYQSESGLQRLLMHFDGSSWSTVSAPMFIEALASTGPEDVWAIGGGGVLAHYDGAQWTIAEMDGMNAISGPALSTIHAAGPCEIQATGRQILSTGEIAALSARLSPTSTGIPGDLDGDALVGFGDLLVLLGAWGPCGAGACPADLDDDGEVAFGDLLLLLSIWS